VVEPKASILLVYIVADQSGSIGRNIDELNSGLASLRDAVQQESSAAANVRVSVIGFSDTAFTYLEPSDLRVLDAMPALTAQSRGSYAGAFDQLAHRITVDVPALAAQGYTVGQPAVFFLTAGRPNSDEDWRSVRADLLDEPAAPAILAFGIGDADETVISQLATKPHYAFVSAPGVDTGAAMSELLTALTQSVISSGQAIGSGSTGLHFDKPQGFTFAADAPTPNLPPPPISTPAPEIPATPEATQPPVTATGPFGQRNGGFVLAGLALLAICLGEVAEVVMRQVLGPPLPAFLVNVSIVTIGMIVGVIIAVRSGQSLARTGMFVLAMVVALVAVPNVVHLVERSSPSFASPDSQQSQSAPSESSAPSTATPTTAPPVTESALDGLLLSPDQISTTMRAAGMVADPDTTTMVDSSAQDPNTACLMMDSGGQATVYANSGWTATRQRRVFKQGAGVGSHQALVLFSSAHDASAFFTVSAQRWPDCANKQWGPFTNTDGTLFAHVTNDCERALTVANNVAIDIATCGWSGSAEAIADQIAAKILTK
jgi:uncharacterized protein YegL